MSTLNVANISDDQSTLSNSANPSDALNNTTTVDTKFVTNGCAKAWVNYKGSVSSDVRNSLNVSSNSEAANGKSSFGLSVSMSGDQTQFSISCSLMNTDLDRIVVADSAITTSSVIGTLRGDPSDARLVSGPLCWSIHGDLA